MNGSVGFKLLIFLDETLRFMCIKTRGMSDENTRFLHYLNNILQTTDYFAFMLF